MKKNKLEVSFVPLIQIPGLKMVERVLFCQLASLARQDGYSYASQQSLCNLIGVRSKHTLKRAIDKLKDKNLIAVIQTYSDVGGKLEYDVQHIYITGLLNVLFSIWNYDDKQKAEYVNKAYAAVVKQAEISKKQIDRKAREEKQDMDSEVSKVKQMLKEFAIIDEIAKVA